MSSKDPDYTLTVNAGPSYDRSTHKPVAVNSPVPHLIDTPHATIDLRVRIQDFTGLPASSPRTSPYFTHPTRANDQYSIAISLIPKHPVSGSDLVFGNDFDHPIRHNLPPGTNQALKIVRWSIDPGLEGDAYADKPYLYGPALSSWNYLRVCGTGSGGVEKEEVIEEGGEDGGEEVRRELGVPDDAAGRKRWFLDEGRRGEWVFERGRLYKADFGNGYLGFNDFSLRLPGFHIHVAKYIDEKNHQLRYVLKNKRTGDVYFVLTFTLLLDECSSGGCKGGNDHDGHDADNSKNDDDEGVD
ncbi:hypothetical protein AJ79_07476 [Helicocarpus griseus UAMH5409]|uniref:Domain of unknown function at the cortex 1 domain-containing protein n=1 Tax=Helicocarpus griseus UAMH5409 TaxID=1447875 RepID=A0A2B7X2M9_9EURO|nr:hypothetical protein AJ79_07476 [Helicocarpus griseus UAMH5409]